MKIGLVSDIHGNHPALEAVLNDMPEVDRVVCAGDIVGYNPMPSTCVDRIQSVADVVVQGNHDRLVETPERYHANQMAKKGLEYAKRTLSDDQRQWLQELPKTATFGNGDYLLVHSHPERQGEYVFPEDFAELRQYLDEYAGVVLGHTHIQQKTHVDDRLVVNPGSVGQPRDGDPKAAYAVLDTDTNSAEIRRTHYNIDRVHHKIVIEGLPSETGSRLFEGN